MVPSFLITPLHKFRELIHREGWVIVAQWFIALFFLAASMYKMQSFFIDADQSLKNHFDYWISLKLPPHWYQTIMTWMLSSPVMEKVLEATALLLQAIPGFLLLINYRTRLAGVLLFLIQINIFLGTLHNSNFNEFVGGSLWICLFFTVRPNASEQWKERTWTLLTWALFLLSALYQLNRYRMGDPWLSSVAWQRAHLEADVMSISFVWKQLVLWVSGTAIGPVLWAGVWWVGAGATALLLVPRYRLYGGSLLLIFAIERTLTWMNAVTSEGVLASLVLFLWVTQEEILKHPRIQ